MMSSDLAEQGSGLVGKRIAGRYLIASVRPSDHAAECYDAEDVAGGDRVVVIVVRADTAAHTRAERLYSIRHPGLVEVLDVGKLDQGKTYVAMERPVGKPLREVAAGKRLEQRRALLIVRQILEALAVAHAAGVVHGNLRPDVIFAMPGLGDERVKLGELGMAALTGAAVDPVYSAAETVRGPIDARADLYAVGVVLVELLTGRPPFVGTDRDALQRLHAYAPVQKLAQRVADVRFSDELEAMVATALAKQRDSRYRGAREMIEVLDRALIAIEEPAPVPPSASADAPDDSLLLIMQELKRQSPPADRAPEVPLIPSNLERRVPVLPWPTRASQTLGRWLDRASATLRIPRRVIGPALAATLGLVLLLAVVCRSGGSGKQVPATRPQAAAVPDVDAGLGSASSPAPTHEAALAARCEQLGNACGDTAKRKSTMVDQCKQAAAKQVQRGCIDAAFTMYDCYEAKLCTKGDKVWALADLDVLSQRHGKCVEETTALRACAGE